MRLMDGGAPPIPELCTHEDCNDCWTGYPESLFPNWTQAQVEKCKIAEAIQRYQYGDCVSHYLDIDANGIFRNSDKFVARAGMEGETWRDLLAIKVSTTTITREHEPKIKRISQASRLVEDESCIHRRYVWPNSPNAGDQVCTILKQH